jgi:hypothetical protein
MNRLSPWIARRSPHFVPSFAFASRAVRPAQAAAFVAAPMIASDDLQLFATTFLGGLVFFGTMIA